jgi:hypothetical protein
VDFNGKRRCCPHFAPLSLRGRVSGGGGGDARTGSPRRALDFSPRLRVPSDIADPRFTGRSLQP